MEGNLFPFSNVPASISFNMELAIWLTLESGALAETFTRYIELIFSKGMMAAECGGIIMTIKSVKCTSDIQDLFLPDKKKLVDCVALRVLDVQALKGTRNS